MHHIASAPAFEFGGRLSVRKARSGCSPQAAVLGKPKFVRVQRSRHPHPLRIHCLALLFADALRSAVFAVRTNIAFKSFGVCELYQSNARGWPSMPGVMPSLAAIPSTIRCCEVGPSRVSRTLEAILVFE